MALSQILNKRLGTNEIDVFTDDIQVHHNFVEYSGSNNKLKYMIFDMELMDKNGDMKQMYKVVRLLKIIRLPKSSKQSLAFMDMHEQVLAGVYERGINFVTTVANIIEPIPLGLLYCYGVQGVAGSLDDAKRIADNDFAALISLLQGTYRTLEFSLLEQNEAEWMRQKMYSMRHLSVVRGLPMPRSGGTDAGNNGMGGRNINPESQGTSEEFIAGMSDKEYILMILSSPVAYRTLREWLTQTAKEITKWQSQMAGSKGINFGISVPMMYAANLGASSGWSQGYSEGESMGFSQGQSFGESLSESFGESQSASMSRGHSEGTSMGFNRGESVGNSFSRGISEGFGTSQGHGTSQSLGQSQSVGQSQGLGQSAGQSTNWGSSQGSSANHGSNFGGELGIKVGKNSSAGTTLGSSFGNGVSEGMSQNVGASTSQGLSKGSGVSNNMGISNSRGSSAGWGQSMGQSRGQSFGASSGNSVGVSRGNSVSRGMSHGFSKGFSQGQSWGSSRGTSMGSSGGMSQGSSASMAVGPSLSFNKSFQWQDREVENIVKLLDFQNERLMHALNGNGAFFTDVYMATPDEETKAASQALAKSAWHNDQALVYPLQVLDLTKDEQEHLLYHLNAFSADTTIEGDGYRNYRYSTVLLPSESTAYTHLPRISEGGIFADVLDIPKFAVPAQRKGEIYVGKILSGERWTSKWGYTTPFDFRLASGELMHAFFTGESRSGKTVLATRIIAELATKIKRNGKRMRIVCMDPKQDWRILAKFIDPKRFKFFSLANPDFCPINLNVCKIPKNVRPQQWVDGLIELFCRTYGLGQRGKAITRETMYELYRQAGVFVENWREVAPERSKQVTLPKIYQKMLAIKMELEDFKNTRKGRIGNDVRDAYSRVLDRLQVFGEDFTIEYRLFGQEDGIGIDDLIGEDDVVVLESYGLDPGFKNFIFSCITSGFFKYAQAHEGGFTSDDQYETILVIEEANEVLCDDETKILQGQSEFEKIMDQAAGLGLFIFAITQKIADMPSSVIANTGLNFIGKISRKEDVETVIRKIGREERYDDRELLKWFARSPIGWFVCRSGRNYDFKDLEPVLVKVDPLGVDAPTNEELKYMQALAEAEIQKK